MAHKITDDCINCGACESACPVDAIAEMDGKRKIDPATCIDCGACKSTCPVDSIES
jgi:ferredoxin